MGEVVLYPQTYAVQPPKGDDGPPESVPSLLKAILYVLQSGIASGGSGFIVVNGTVYAYDYQAFTYFGSTNNIETITYKQGGSGGTTVATQTFTYVGGGAADNDNVASIATT